MTARLLLSSIVVLLFGASQAAAIPVVLYSVADSTIDESTPTTNFGTSPILEQIVATGDASHALIEWDLSALAGYTVTGDGMIRVKAVPDTELNPGTVTFTTHIFPVLVGWDESTVTWTSFFANTPPLTAGSISSMTYDITAGEILPYPSIDAAVLQSWIDSPSTNFGILMVAMDPVNGVARYLESREGATFDPELTFDVAIPGVPEPSTMLLVGGGLAAVVAVRRRRLTARR